MATESVVRKSDESDGEVVKAISVKRTYSPAFLEEQAVIEKRVREEGARRIQRSVERAIAMGIVDKAGNRLKKELPADMQPDADRDFGG